MLLLFFDGVSSDVEFELLFGCMESLVIVVEIVSEEFDNRSLEEILNSIFFFLFLVMINEVGVFWFMIIYIVN